MPGMYTVEVFDRQTEARTGASLPVREARKAHAALAKQHINRRMRAILDAPVSVRINGEVIEAPAIEAMALRLRALVLADPGLVADRDRIAAFKVLTNMVYGAPKQTVEHIQPDPAGDIDPYANVPAEDLARLQSDMERLLATAPVKVLGPNE